jgi:hypothetical protein
MGLKRDRKDYMETNTYIGEGSGMHYALDGIDGIHLI